MTGARVLLLAGLVVGGAVSPAGAAQPEIRDQAGFFSADAIRRANRGLEEIKRRHGKDLVIETYPAPPSEVAARLAQEPRERVYADWVQRRAGDAGINGIYVVVTRSPSHLQVGVGSETRRAAFTTQDRDRLRDLLLEAFRKRQYDEGLQSAVDYTQRTLELNLGASRQSPSSAPATAPARERATGGLGGFSWSTILLWGGLILAGLWAVTRMFRNRAAEASRLGPGSGVPGAPGYRPGDGPGAAGPGTPGYGYGPQYGGGQYGGGGFGRGLLGGVLGGMAGGYLWDRLRGRDAAEAGGPAPADRPLDDPTVGDEADFASSGGDFGPEPGGGDVGGGGDFGGDAGDSSA